MAMTLFITLLNEILCYYLWAVIKLLDSIYTMYIKTRLGVLTLPYGIKRLDIETVHRICSHYTNCYITLSFHKFLVFSKYIEILKLFQTFLEH